MSLSISRPTVAPLDLVARGGRRVPSPGRGAPTLVFPEGYVPGRSPAILELYGRVRAFLDGDAPVLLLGETGVGKEQLARMLYLSSRRAAAPFVAVNCAAIPADLLEAEMFGIARGVATGVLERRGNFQLAEGGTLFLDEIGEMPLALQAKLLRALQGKEIRPVGGAPKAIDVRVVAATNSDIERRMDDGRFRRDLYYRIAGFVLHVPALRERRDDIPALVERFLGLSAREAGRAVRGIAPCAMRALVGYSWPGNVRELEHEVRRLVHLCPDGGEITARLVSEHILQPPRKDRGLAPSSLRLDANVDDLERRLIAAALARTGGKRAPAARLLGISRNGLALKIARLGLAEGQDTQA
jgi:two-component system NtrC family response regulator